MSDRGLSLDPGRAAQSERMWVFFKFRPLIAQ